jgi:hypothetical protein
MSVPREPPARQRVKPRIRPARCMRLPSAPPLGAPPPQSVQGYEMIAGGAREAPGSGGRLPGVKSGR